MKDIPRIASFTVDHDLITPGIYISRIDGDVITYDLRTRTPNSGDLMSNAAMHSLEHMFATYVRASEIGDKVLYFGPMGCQTGFYLLVRDCKKETVGRVVLLVLRSIISHSGEMFGATRKAATIRISRSLLQKRNARAIFLCSKGAK